MYVRCGSHGWIPFRWLCLRQFLLFFLRLAPGLVAPCNKPGSTSKGLKTTSAAGGFEFRLRRLVFSFVDAYYTGLSSGREPQWRLVLARMVVTATTGDTTDQSAAQSASGVSIVWLSLWFTFNMSSSIICTAAKYPLPPAL